MAGGSLLLFLGFYREAVTSQSPGSAAQPRHPGLEVKVSIYPKGVAQRILCNAFSVKTFSHIVHPGCAASRDPGLWDVTPSA